MADPRSTGEGELPAPGRAFPLEVREVSIRFGGLLAVDAASLRVDPGRTVGLIGPNGAGKTTLFECISGFHTPDAGSISYGDTELIGLPPWERPRLSIGRTLQSVRLFPELTVFDNCRIAHHLLVDSDAVGDALSLLRSRRAETRIYEHANEILSLVGLDFFREKLAAELSYGTLRLLEIACILALRPRFLLLDEPSAGISQKETEELGPLLKNIQEATSSSILIIEHDIPLVMSLADEIYAMDAGRMIAHGTPQQIAKTDVVIESYLGRQEIGEGRSGGNRRRDGRQRTPARVRERTADQPADGGEPLLEVRGLEVHYGRVQVLYEVDLDVYPGEMVALLGTNGAGKSTVLKAISGLLRPSRGKVVFEGKDITRAPAERTVRMGIGQVPSGRGVFPTLTVEENLTLGGFIYPKSDGRVREELDRVLTYFPRLAERRGQPAGTLSGGEQQMLAIGRALLTRPRLLMIDEMSLGLAPILIQQLIEIIQRLHDAEDVTILVVEQHATFALSFTDRAYFLEKGEVRFAGPSRELGGREDLLRSVFLAGATAGFGGRR